MINDRINIVDLSETQTEIERLDLCTAYKKRVPIRHAEDMTFKLLWDIDGIDDEWRRALSTKWWSSNFENPELLINWQKDSLKFSARLLKFGGNEVCIPGKVGDLVKLNMRGQLWPGQNVLLKIGAQSQCHANSAYLWHADKENKNLHIATGYALTADDGMWRQHTWCVLEKQRSIQIIETTVPRSAYFGYVLTSTEQEEFYNSNVMLE